MIESKSLEREEIRVQEEDESEEDESNMIEEL